MARFRLTPEAETQIGDIVEFIATERENAALRFRDALYDAFELLAAHKGIGHAREDLRHTRSSSGACGRSWWCTTRAANL